MTPEDVCSIDWGKVFDAIKDVIIACAAMFTAWVAWRGISKWQTEYRAKAYFEGARLVATALYGLRDTLAYARQAMVLTSEYPPGFNGFGNGATANAQCYAHVFANRLKPAAAAAIELQTARHEAEALWGKDARELIDAVLKCVHELRVAMQAFVTNEQHAGADIKTDLNWGDLMMAWVFDVTRKYPEADLNPASKMISDRIAAVDHMLQQHLRIGKNS